MPSLLAPLARTSNLPSSFVLVWPSCWGAPALASHRVTVDFAMGALPPNTWPLTLSAAKAWPTSNKLKMNTNPTIIVLAMHRVVTIFSPLVLGIVSGLKKQCRKTTTSSGIGPLHNQQVDY